MSDPLAPTVAEPAVENVSQVGRLFFSPRTNLWILRGGTFFYFCFLNLMLLHPDPWTLLGFEPRGRIASAGLSVVHCVIFTLLAIGVEWGRIRLPLWISLAALFLFSPASEILQIFTGRAFEGIDIAQDTLGVVFGTLFAYFLRPSCLPKRSPTPPEKAVKTV